MQICEWSFELLCWSVIGQLNYVLSWSVIGHLNYYADLWLVSWIIMICDWLHTRSMIRMTDYSDVRMLEHASLGVKRVDTKNCCNLLTWLVNVSDERMWLVVTLYKRMLILTPCSAFLLSSVTSLQESLSDPLLRKSSGLSHQSVMNTSSSAWTRVIKYCISIKIKYLV